MEQQEYNQLKNFLQQNILPTHLSTVQERKLVSKSRSFTINNGNLYKKNKQDRNQPLRVIQKEEMPSILEKFHSEDLAGHMGINATYSKIKERYYWNNMYQDVKDYVQSCDLCQRKNKPKRTELLHSIPVKQPFDLIGIDIVGPLPITDKGNRYIVTACEYLTKWPEARALSEITAEQVAKFVYEDIICRHSAPKAILTDNGTQFTSQILEHLTNNMQIKRKFSTPYHPKTNGLIERFNKTLCSCLSKLVYQFKRNWDEVLPSALFAYRSTINSTTKYTPFFLLYGRTPRFPSELDPPVKPEQLSDKNFEKLVVKLAKELEIRVIKYQTIASENIQKAQKKQKQYHDNRITTNNTHKFQIGDLVLKELVQKKDKLDLNMDGPYYIHQAFPNGVYKLRNIDGKVLRRKINGERLVVYRHSKLKPIVEI